MFKLLHILVPLLGAERAHDWVVALLHWIGKLPGAKWLMSKIYAVHHPSLEREVFGLKFKNPVGIAAGYDRNGEIFRELGALGFGFVEIGTVTPVHQPGNPKPRIFRLDSDKAILNRVGLSVGKKLGGAVVRNRAKRLLREAYRAVKETGGLKTGYLVVLAARDESRGKKATDVTADMMRAFRALGMLAK